jgi:hypothetical protein
MCASAICALAGTTFHILALTSNKQTIIITYKSVLMPPQHLHTVHHVHALVQVLSTSRTHVLQSDLLVHTLLNRQIGCG